MKFIMKCSDFISRGRIFVWNADGPYHIFQIEVSKEEMEEAKIRMNDEELYDIDFTDQEAYERCACEKAIEIHKNFVPMENYTIPIYFEVHNDVDNFIWGNFEVKMYSASAHEGHKKMVQMIKHPKPLSDKLGKILRDIRNS